jgi:hypothetical protein
VQKRLERGGWPSDNVAGAALHAQCARTYEPVVAGGLYRPGNVDSFGKNPLIVKICQNFEMLLFQCWHCFHQDSVGANAGYAIAISNLIADLQ